jgi:hypothetical protein
MFSKSASVQEERFLFFPLSLLSLSKSGEYETTSKGSGVSTILCVRRVPSWWYKKLEDFVWCEGEGENG